MDAPSVETLHNEGGYSLLTGTILVSNTINLGEAEDVRSSPDLSGTANKSSAGSGH